MLRHVSLTKYRAYKPVVPMRTDLKAATCTALSALPVRVKACASDSGYLSQLGKAADARAVILPMPDLFTNPKYRTFASRLINYWGADRLCVVDEADVFKLFVECSLSVERLKKLGEMWRGETLGDFVECILALLDADNFYKIGQVLALLTDGEVKQISEQLRSLRIKYVSGAGYVSYQIMSLDDAVAGGYRSADTEQSIENLESVDRNFGLLEQLQIFFTHYRRIEDAPISFHQGMLRWWIPPQLHPKVKKIGFMSATANLDFFKRLFPDAVDLDVPMSQWVQGAEFYQLRTAKCPRATVLELKEIDTGWEFVGMKPAGEKLWQMIIAEIQNTHDLRHAIISYKDVLTWAAVDVKELGIVTANYGGLVGLDTEFQDVDVLWVVFSPELKPEDVEWRTKMLFGNDDLTLDFSRSDDGRYVDERVQAVYESGVIAELIQAVGRARLNRKPRKVVLLCSHRLPGVTDRSESVLFDETDFEVAGGLDGLAQVVRSRESAERLAESLTGENTVAEFQVAWGCSESQARRLWTLAGGDLKKACADDTLRSEIIALKKQGLSLRAIEKKLGISRRKINRILSEN